MDGEVIKYLEGAVCWFIWISLEGMRGTQKIVWYFSDRASWIDYTLITNLMQWLLFIHKILFSSFYMFRASNAHLQEDTVVYMQHMVLSLSTRVTVPYAACIRHPPTTFPLQSVLTQAVYRQATTNSRREWQYHRLHVYNCILLKVST